MPAPFDPYHKWLGIGSDEQPATLYRLLGLRPFESDAEVIDMAASQRLALLKSFQAGQHAALAQKLHNEISRARQRLLNKTERAAYDSLLREQYKRQAASGTTTGTAWFSRPDLRWPEGKQPKTLDEFIECVISSGLLTLVQLTEFQERLPTDKKPKDPKGLATELVRGKKMSKHQALSLLRGKPRSLTFGEYSILDKLGEGGMGQVLKAEHRRMKRVVALKLLSSDTFDDADSIRRFQQEVQAAARLIHTNIVTAFDANEHDGVHYYVMEYVQGIDLGALLKTHGPLPVATALDYVLQAARGLAYAHAKGVVHRDIKPSNLLVDRDGTVKILDMGLARVEKHDGSPQLTTDGQVLGTVDFMAPEQAVDTHDVDARADVYSLGCTLYRLLTGEVLYSGETVMRKLIAHRESPIPSLRDKRSDIPAAVEHIWRKMVAKSADERQQSMGEVIAQLESCLRGGPQSASLLAEPADSVAYRLNELVANLSRDPTGGSVGKFPSISGAAFGTVTLEATAAPPTAATDVTQNLKSGETDPDTLVTIRAQSEAAPDIAPAEMPQVAANPNHSPGAVWNNSRHGALAKIPVGLWLAIGAISLIAIILLTIAIMVSR